MFKVLLPSILITWYLTPSEASGQIFLKNLFEISFLVLFFVLVVRISEEV